MIFQRTIKESISVTGVGLHSGCRVSLTLKPNKENHGIVFVRTDLPNKPSIKCDPFTVNDTRLSSTLVDANNVRVATIEHLMSALACYGIDNIIIELSAQEVPIMDGSSNSFLYLLNQAKVVDQNAKKKYIRIKKKLIIEENDKWVALDVFNGYKIKLSINFPHPLFKPEYSTLEIDFSKQSYIEEISRARTFGFMYEVENLRKNGLGLGGNVYNAIVIDEESVLNEGGLRYKDEFVRHKILDAIGDLYILGHQIIGSFSGYKSGHAINNKLIRELLQKKDVWEFVTFSNEDDAPLAFHHLN